MPLLLVGLGAISGIRPSGVVHACDPKSETPQQTKLPVWEGVRHREFERALLEACKNVESIDTLIEQLKASKAPHWVRYPGKMVPGGVDQVDPYVSVLITPVRSIHVDFDKDTRVVKGTYIVNTFL